MIQRLDSEEYSFGGIVYNSQHISHGFTSHNFGSSVVASSSNLNQHNFRTADDRSSQGTLRLLFLVGRGCGWMDHDFSQRRARRLLLSSGAQSAGRGRHAPQQSWLSVGGWCLLVCCCRNHHGYFLLKHDIVPLVLHRHHGSHRRRRRGTSRRCHHEGTSARLVKVFAFPGLEPVITAVLVALVIGKKVLNPTSTQIGGSVLASIRHDHRIG
mmetsp:Transcript_20175/g.43556  ORF Transcript_20175/g.43556 Transcript_20175/m.43556 type:complete len:212 (-) Transcript_20175:856-1491(-)